ncbi:MAG TPA: STAS domain-containing protein [Actinophytocola sp.]|uniref:STAS domain-containing protein n=1 Tax=Actinophytocola sp. TaxID=1872138 RepID=UPI002DDD0CDA|nr:STAS domain-containing protein [Actinophytocola sp.]HEV2778897.1 STAS domain-containing protein [Actinophytocola sp.]
MSVPQLRIAHEIVGNAVVVHVAGEIDMANAPVIKAHLDRACHRAHPPQTVVADLTEVVFLGSAGLSVLLEVDEACRGRRTPLWVVATTPGVVRPLRVTGMDQVLKVADSLDSVVQTA